MSDFFYRAKDLNNKIVNGYLSAVSVSDAVSQLEYKGYIVLEVREEANNFNEKFIPVDNNVYLSINEKKEFFNSFYMMYKSGLSIIEIFNSILSSSRNLRIKTLCANILGSLNRGELLKDAMQMYSKPLGLAYISLIAAGEESGKLDEVLSGIITNLNKEEEIKGHIISSLTYPVIIFLFAIGVWLLFKYFVFEVFVKIGDDFNIKVIALSAIFKIVLVYLIIFAAAFILWKNKIVLNKIKDLILKFGFISNIMKNYYFANFFLVMGLAYESGITADVAINLANSVINNVNVNRKIKKAEKMVQQGCLVATALSATNVFSANVISQISAGEKAGELEKVFKSSALYYENSLNLALQAALKMLEPVMILIVGILVAYIAIKGYNGYYSAIYSLM